VQRLEFDTADLGLINLDSKKPHLALSKHNLDEFWI